jgi:hypothetical protein
MVQRERSYWRLLLETTMVGERKERKKVKRRNDKNLIN